MDSKEEKQRDDLEKLTELISRTLELFEEDRTLAKENYDSIDAQLAEALVESEWGYTDGAKLEAEKNKSVDLYMKAGDRLTKAIEAMSKIVITNLNNENRLQVASKLTLGANGERLIDEPASIQDIQKKILTG